MVAAGGARLATQIVCVVALCVVSSLAAGATAARVALGFQAIVTPPLVATDVIERRLPNRLVYPAILLGALTVGVEWAQSGALPAAPVVATVAFAGFLLLLSLAGGMGMGDVKLAAALGLASWSPGVAVLSPVIAFLVGGVASIILLARRGRGGTIAFGPFLLAGFWCAVAISAWSRLAAL